MDTTAGYQVKLTKIMVEDKKRDSFHQVQEQPPMSAECERLFSSSGLMVTPLRPRLEATTIGLAQTVRSWLKAGVIHDSVMDVPDLDTKNHREEGSDPVKDDFNEGSGDDTGAVSSPEDGDGEVEVVTLFD